MSSLRRTRTTPDSGRSNIPLHLLLAVAGVWACIWINYEAALLAPLSPAVGKGADTERGRLELLAVHKRRLFAADSQFNQGKPEQVKWQYSLWTSDFHRKTCEIELIPHLELERMTSVGIAGGIPLNDEALTCLSVMPNC